MLEYKMDVGEVLVTDSGGKCSWVIHESKAEQTQTILLANNLDTVQICAYYRNNKLNVVFKSSI